VTHIVFLARVFLYYGIYPGGSLLRRDYMYLEQNMYLAETKLIPVTDSLAFVVGILHFLTIINGYKDKNAEFFKMAK
jgi:hypothetical protein